MIWDDKGFLLSKNKYNENSLISEIYTKNFGKVSGIIFFGDIFHAEPKYYFQFLPKLLNAQINLLKKLVIYDLQVFRKILIL